MSAWHTVHVRINDATTGAILPQFAIGPANVATTVQLMFGPPPAVPALGIWSLCFLVLLMVGALTFAIRRRYGPPLAE
jgi:hypothetical protein